MAPQGKTQAEASQVDWKKTQAEPAPAAPNDAEPKASCVPSPAKMDDEPKTDLKPVKPKASTVSSPTKMDDEPTKDVKAIPLSFLTLATAKFGTWEVCVVRPKIETYTYSWNGQERQGQYFRCTLVSTDDDTKYCLAEVRKVKGSPANIFEKATVIA